ncbi:MAG: type I glyceraldehyde-3-phosphate dehydrogenase [Flavobacteriales bacterium]|nr:type I glyceraldehyde-3-phosphate dehydrogenase [Flavobacteriales bacterium]
MSKIRVAINGFGRIGRVFGRVAINSNEIELVAVNDLTDNHTLAHLFKYDSVHGKFNGDVSYSNEGLIINGKTIRVFEEKDPSNLPWGELGIDVVVESTGIFRTKETAGKHILAGAKKVIISAPAKGGGVPGIVMGVNHHQIPNVDIISNASCTTNCAAPMVAVIDELCKIDTGFITTVHAYTGDQRIHDAPHSDLRRARAASNSIIPTSTGAADAVGEIFPHLNGKLDGSGIRVPVIDGSLTEMTCTVMNPVSVEEINRAFMLAAEGKFKGILAYTDEPLVSCDIIGNPHSCIFDSEMTKVIGNQIQITGWYDNEFGYSNRLVDLILEMNK